ncbi:MAG: ABC transporter ATP-binding protein/permease [Bacteroidia bacterium]|nr:ABC transporter ATP-binding protein/permease [Bacteroidia bacterium]
MLRLSLRVLSYCRPYWKSIIAMFVCLIFFVIFNLASFATLVPFLDTLFDTNLKIKQPQEVSLWNTNSIKEYAYYKLLTYIQNHGRMHTLYLLCVILFVVFLLKNLFAYLVTYFLAIIEGGIVRDFRKAIFEHLTQLSLSYFTDERKGELIVRMTSDIEQVQSSVVGSFKGLIRHPLVATSLLMAMFFISWKLTLFVLLILPISGYAISRVSKTLKKNASIGQDKLSRLISIVDEVIVGMRIVKAFVSEKREQEKFNKENDAYYQTYKKVYRRRELVQPLTETLSVVIIVVVLLYGGSLIIHGTNQMTAALFLTYIGIFSQLLPPIKGIGIALGDIAKGTASSERIFKLLDTVPTIINVSQPVPFPKNFTTIEYKNVHFSYGEKSILQGINLTIRRGEIIALVGPSGSGKTTLADLLPRFHDVQAGEILIDDINIKQFDISTYRSHFGIVTQHPILFNDTILNNIRYGKPDATMEEVIEAAKVANAHEFILQTEKGYHTYVGERGSKLSGGQQQRICIARAILQNPEILILDEATSALDNESEKLVQEALYTVMKGRTCIVIAHRLSTIQNADRIVVLEKGKIVEMGTHQELSQKGGLYYKYLSMMQIPFLS